MVTLEVKSGLFERAMRNVRNAWDRIAGAEQSFSAADLSPDLSGMDEERLTEQMRACLDSLGGEVSARGRAAALGRAYLALDEVGRRRFLGILAGRFDVDHGAVEEASARLCGAQDEAQREKAERELRLALLAPRVKLLTQFNVLPEGVKFLVDMRAELLALSGASPELRGLEDDLKTLLTSWFDVGFLELRRITWEAPAALLEKLIAYEAVHEIQGWDDLKNRLASDRRCFAFFHPRMPDEPLIFVWVALVNGMADNIQTLLDQGAPIAEAEAQDTAIFYSISNAQDGLRGVAIGSFLIKRVVDSLTAELNGLKTFATLSPIPGFLGWLRRALEAEGEGLLRAEEREVLAGLANDQQPEAFFISVLDNPLWPEDASHVQAMRAPLLRLCARYLLEERRNSGTSLDSVAHFHLNNGARIEQLNWLADCSRKGIEQSAGIMLNYLYEVENIDVNHEAYRGDSEIIASAVVRELIK